MHIREFCSLDCTSEVNLISICHDVQQEVIEHRAGICRTYAGKNSLLTPLPLQTTNHSNLLSQATSAKYYFWHEATYQLARPI
jgi:hypothetical protein